MSELPLVSHGPRSVEDKKNHCRHFSRGQDCRTEAVAKRACAESQVHSELKEN